jgi:hypothetical protein
MKKLFLCITLSLLVLAACSTAPSLKNTETRLYTNLAGYHIKLPVAWQLLEEEQLSAIFSAPDNEISLTILSELGGEAYYGLNEIADMLLAQLPGSVIPWQTGRAIVDNKKELRLSVLGEDESGAEVVLDLTIFQPYPGMRYYLLFACGRAAAAQQGVLISDIVKSFGLDEDQAYLYTLMNEWREDGEADVTDEADEIDEVDKVE